MVVGMIVTWSKSWSLSLFSVDNFAPTSSIDC